MIRATVAGTIPSAQVGEEFTMTARARVTGVRERLVDVTAIGGNPAFLPGERDFELLITEVVATAVPKEEVQTDEQAWPYSGETA